MGVESELRGLPEMQQNVRTWLAWRPTIHHTQESLTGILNGEIAELREAVAQGKPQAEISLEVGDVLFSTLALDRNTNNYKPHYSTIAKYCKLAGTSLKKLFDETSYKNEVNYPIYFFHRPSPFIDSADAVSCIRVFRVIDENPTRLVQRWADSEAAFLQLPFMDAYGVSRLFRNFIKSSLTEIKQNKKTGPETVAKINKLLSTGRWNSVPLELAADKPQNDLILF